VRYTFERKSHDCKTVAIVKKRHKYEIFVIPGTTFQSTNQI